MKKFKLLTVEELEDLESPGWLVKDVLPEKSLVQMFGREGSGKTFVALDLALRVAAGMLWDAEGKTEPRRVVYVVGEGLLGVRKRIHAWREYHKVSGNELRGFRAIDEAVLLGESDHVNGLLDSIEEVTGSREVDLLVFDTQARCTAGMDENSAEDMGVVVAALDWLRVQTGGSILLIHHAPYNEKDRGRGSSAMPGAIDTAIAVENHNGVVQLRCTKQKDWEEFETISCGIIKHGESAVAARLVASSAESLMLKIQQLPEKSKELLEQIAGSEPAPSSVHFGRWNGGNSTYYKALHRLLDDGILKVNQNQHLELAPAFQNLQKPVRSSVPSSHSVMERAGTGMHSGKNMN